MFFDCLACWASFTGYYLNQNNSLSLITFPVLCFSAKGEWMTIMLICLLWILNLSFCDNSNPWLFLESTVPGLAVTISHVPLSSAASSSFSYPQKWLCVFVLCSVNVFVKKMRVHDLAIPPVTSNLTAQSARATTSHTQCEMTAFNTCEGYVIWQQFKRGQREDFFCLFHNQTNPKLTGRVYVQWQKLSFWRKELQWWLGGWNGVKASIAHWCINGVEQ